MSKVDEGTHAALALLESCGGLLLESDPELPSVAALIAGGPVRGSWWGHPLGSEIYHILSALSDHADVTVCKLVGGKVTLVHRSLWPALTATGSSREEWQTHLLPPGARALAALVDDAGRARADSVEVRAVTAPQLARHAVREVELRLLAHVKPVHNERGAPTKQLTRWDLWAIGAGVGALPPVDTAESALEEAVRTLGGDADALLPWRRRPDAG